MNRNKPIGWAVVACMLFCMVFLSSFEAVLALPPRPSPEPEATSTPQPRSDVDGAAILLHVEPAPTSATMLYAIVQWQDGLEAWHDVGGWAGMLEEQEVLWQVHKKDFGTGPFRWVIYQGDELVVASEPFYLPAGTRQIVRVVVSLTDE